MRAVDVEYSGGAGLDRSGPIGPAISVVGNREFQRSAALVTDRQLEIAREVGTIALIFDLSEEFRIVAPASKLAIEAVRPVDAEPVDAIIEATECEMVFQARTGRHRVVAAQHIFACVCIDVESRAERFLAEDAPFRGEGELERVALKLCIGVQLVLERTGDAGTGLLLRHPLRTARVSLDGVDLVRVQTSEAIRQLLELGAVNVFDKSVPVEKLGQFDGLPVVRPKHRS